MDFSTVTTVADWIQTYRVNSSWDKYIPLGKSVSKARASKLRLRDSAVAPFNSVVYPLEGLNNSQPIPLDLMVAADWPKELHTGYSDDAAVEGGASLSIADNSYMDDLVGKPVDVHIDLGVNTSTELNGNNHGIEFDLGTMLTGALIYGVRQVNMSPHSARAAIMAFGILNSAVQNYWNVKVSWRFKHQQKINSNYDDFNFHVNVTVRGFRMTEVIKQYFGSFRRDFGHPTENPALRSIRFSEDGDQEHQDYVVV